MNKYCYRCRQHKPSDWFPIIRHKDNVYKTGRNCGECHEIKIALLAKHTRRGRIFKPSATREKELALIPNPFIKKESIIDVNQFLLPGGFSGF